MSLTVALALSGLGSDQHWGGDFDELCKRGAMLFPNGLPKSPSVSSIASTASTSSRYSSESGISSMPDLGSSYQALESLIDNVFDEQGLRIEARQFPPIPKEVKEVMVNYEGRDLLNLCKNIMGAWDFAPAALSEGVGNFYFENRSQYSRLQGAKPPPHSRLLCPDCDFIEHKYD